MQVSIGSEEDETRERDDRKNNSVIYMTTRVIHGKPSPQKWYHFVNENDVSHMTQICATSRRS